MLRIVHVVGARPNFMKIAPLLRALDSENGVVSSLVHTGQHYDDAMSASFFRDLGIRAPDVDLAVGPGSHGAQTAAVLERFEAFLLEHPADLVTVVGDVNSTLAAALAAAKLGVAVAHVEAGLRSRDLTMPEEMNRILTDQLSDLCFTPGADADANLSQEGIADQRIHRVGNIMIDSLMHALPRAREIGAASRLGLERGRYGLVTLHRPSNVDDGAVLAGILGGLEAIAAELPLLFPVHPRTRERARSFGLAPRQVRMIDPIGYLDMMSLVESSALVLTDSGGLQEETTALGIPCLTLRDTTERPVTVTEGTNTLVPDRSRDAIVAAYHETRSRPKSGRCPELWDGHTAERIRDVIRWWSSGRWAGSGR